MREENLVGDGEGEGESDDVGTAVVDIGIAIEIDEDDDPDATVELEFDEAQFRKGGDDATADATVDDEPRLEDGEREQLEEADVDPDAVLEKECSYRMLLDADVDEATADALRRRLSLPWSYESDGDLDRRSSEVRGLGDAEREWIAVSEDEDWQSFEYDRSATGRIDRERPSERPWPKPTPVTAVTGIGPDDAETLAEAGIRSAERLATIDALDVASILDIDVLHVRTWRHNARELLG